ncbi:hypothetical protein H5392_04645 [Tessaracoccus sp. MC1865]|uniref:hypothetical protein n=1 Tax=Tessaracoccus sp. MC1865 TaxID=2760310 RepID=UPI0015FEC937|nr:hypothetical protein [Tessaracoccus sp. MC1865]MBB1483150.1 hypothetical protein [Tessaracoccus sp. MC1865]QTO37424.1 hypothetical protein J7D54_13575 [Tessaracoccus sp. MC1865]
MMMGLAIAFGMLTGFGSLLVIRGALTAPVRLDDALALLDRRQTPAEPAGSVGVDNWGERLHRRLRLPLTARQQRLLLMQDRTVGDFFVEKLVWTVTGFFLPALWGGLQFAMGRPVGLTPFLVALAGATAGYFIADLRLRSGSEEQKRSAVDGIHTFFDLAVLERLANASAAQAAANAAAISDAALFRRISAGLERARMEQVQPWPELRRIAAEWGIPELADFSDVMQLEEQGAGVADALRARVRELRDAHLSQQKAKAQEASEAMTLWMTIPALLLGVALVAPALLTLIGG